VGQVCPPIFSQLVGHNYRETHDTMKHILLNRAFEYRKRKDIIPPKDYVYNSILGAWFNPNSRLPLVFADDFKAQGTKKFDVETGEDNKGQ